MTDAIPTIHANGVDDDLAGLVALAMNEPVIFHGRVYAPGETVTIKDASIYLSKGLVVLGGGDRTPGIVEDGSTVTVTAPSGASRQTDIENCSFRGNPDLYTHWQMDLSDGKPVHVKYAVGRGSFSL